MNEKQIAGLNVQQPWAKLVVNGTKSIETRYYRMPKKHLGKPIAIIETPGPTGNFKARIIGIAVFGESFEYKSKLQFSRDEKKHLVDLEDESVGWKKGRTKWAWPIQSVVSLPTPTEAPRPRGIVFCSNCLVPTKLLSLLASQ